jgi:hypothetical protein
MLIIMEFENDCVMDKEYLEVGKSHGMSQKEFFGQNKSYYCPSCPNWDCHAKKEIYKS